MRHPGQDALLMMNVDDGIAIPWYEPHFHEWHIDNSDPRQIFYLNFRMIDIFLGSGVNNSKPRMQETTWKVDFFTHSPFYVLLLVTAFSMPCHVLSFIACSPLLTMHLPRPLLNLLQTKGNPGPTLFILSSRIPWLSLCQGKTLFQSSWNWWALVSTLCAGDWPVSMGLWVF